MNRTFTKYPGNYVKANSDYPNARSSRSTKSTTKYPKGLDGTVAAYCDKYGQLPLVQVYQSVLSETGDEFLAERVMNKVIDLRGSGF